MRLDGGTVMGANVDGEQHQPGLQHGKNADQPMGFNPQVLDIQRDEDQPHHRSPALADVVSNDVFLEYAHVIISQKGRREKAG